MVNLYTGLEQVTPRQRKSLLKALKNLSDFDNDFNGFNGSEYLWDGVDSKNFDSNRNYLLNEVKDIKNDEECILIFFKTWMKNDDYYDMYEYNTIADKNGDVIAISFSAVHEC